MINKEQDLIVELRELRERMRRVVGMYDSDIDLVTQAIDEVSRLRSRCGEPIE